MSVSGGVLLILGDRFKIYIRYICFNAEKLISLRVSMFGFFVVVRIEVTNMNIYISNVHVSITLY